MRLLIYCFFSIVSGLALFFFEEPVMVGLLTGVATALLIPIIDMALNHPYGLRFMLTCMKLRNQHVRVSASYLLRIEHLGKFLLIRGNRYPDQFQPVGGVYKFNPSSRTIFRKWGLQNDDLIPIDEVSSDDLRVRLKGKHLLSFMNWFKSGEGREQGAFREFYEELVADGPLPLEKLTNIRFDFARRHINPIRYSSYAQSHELLIADVYDVVLSENQIKILHSLTSEDPEKFAWVEGSRIARRGAVPGQAQEIKIAMHAEWLL